VTSCWDASLRPVARRRHCSDLAEIAGQDSDGRLEIFLEVQIRLGLARLGLGIGIGLGSGLDFPLER